MRVELPLSAFKQCGYKDDAILNLLLEGRWMMWIWPSTAGNAGSGDTGSRERTERVSRNSILGISSKSVESVFKTRQGDGWKTSGLRQSFLSILKS
jgi:hypothetical protein